MDDFERTIAGGEAAHKTRYLLMQDGSVFKWDHGATLWSLPQLTLGLLAGLALGGVVVAAVHKRAERQARRYARYSDST